MRLRITSIRKAGGYHENPYTAIETLGWLNEQTGATGDGSRQEMCDWVKAGGFGYVVGPLGDVAQLITGVSARGVEFVRTVADRVGDDYLWGVPTK